ncbi:TPA: phosphoribosylformylglycinamidine synthase subunit PurL [bacterium]|nr:phosphoribosylformylglycinamidine synthase subunit PurL [bacterium]
MLKKGDEEIKKELKNLNISLTLDEVRKISKAIGREPSIVELYIFNAEWSEHCSYKSSRNVLKMLPTKAPNVVLGPGEDAGIVRLFDKYCLVVAHESHNHPSQVLPYEGAATGIGGIVRDINCMGAEVIGVCDPLRFGENEYIIKGVIEGVGGYGNPLGVPNLGGDTYFNSSFNDNCLVNVIALGLVSEEDIIHSKIPDCAKDIPYSIVIIGKATDASGFCGASFASEILDSAKERKEAVQVPDPFLKNVLFKANKELFRLIKEKNVEIAFKDLGGGGLACGTSEIGGDFGIEIELSLVPQIEGLLPEVITCSETQERFIMAVPDSIIDDVLKLYNEDWELPNISEKASAAVIGKVLKEPRYILRHNGKTVCDLPVSLVVGGISYDREEMPIECRYEEPDQEIGTKNLKDAILNVISHPNVSSKKWIYSSYDMEVQGKTVIRPGEADSSLIAPLIEKGISVGVACSCDCNPLQGRIDPYLQAVNAVLEAQRNVASIGATPVCLTDCLNYGNPEKPEAFWQFKEGVRGITDACKELWLKDYPEYPMPVVSGNVSFYNESSSGTSIDPSPIIACFGIIRDISKAITMEFKDSGNPIFLVGERKDELGASVYYQTLGFVGRNIPKPDLEKERENIHKIIELINDGFILSCHDISDGGMITTIIEMAILGDLGAEIDIEGIGTIREDKRLFSETPGFILEVKKGYEGKIKLNQAYHIGYTIPEKKLIIKDLIDIPIDTLKKAWMGTL